MHTLSAYLFVTYVGFVWRQSELCVFMRTASSVHIIILGGKNLIYIYSKLVDCLEKRLIYRHIRRFADWFYYSFTTFNELSLDMQKHLRSCRIDRCTTLRDTSKRKNKISTTYKAAFLTPTQENRNAAFFMPSCYAVRANKALIYAALRARK